MVTYTFEHQMAVKAYDDKFIIHQTLVIIL